MAEEERSWLPTRKRRPALRPPALVCSNFTFADVVRSSAIPSDSAPLQRPLAPSASATLHCESFASRPPLTGANVVPLPAKRSRLKPAVDRSTTTGPSGSSGPDRGNRLVKDALTMQSSDDYLGDRPLLPFCQHCLARDHYRAQCRSPIRCLACRRWGHTAAFCDFYSGKDTGVLTGGGNGRG